MLNFQHHYSIITPIRDHSNMLIFIIHVGNSCAAYFYLYFICIYLYLYLFIYLEPVISTFLGFIEFDK